MMKKLPIGIEDFEELIQSGFYYVDKTGLIRELLQNWGKVNLFTRPRRFGKSLMMSMLERFFEIGGDPAIFDGLAIAGEQELCREYMGRFPVISISLKGVSGESFENSRTMLNSVIGKEALRFQFLAESDRLTQKEKALYEQLVELSGRDGETFQMSGAVMTESLQTLSMLLEKHYGSKVILLIDEYDVPLAKAFEYGYYDRMVHLIRSLFEQALKTNDSLKFAVLTGCMRISKESIFTGLNNLKVLSVSDVRFEEYFGFTDAEVRALLEYYGCTEKYETVKTWYDGYQFGSVQVYCPWDVLNYCDLLRADPDAQPQNYWINTSSNDVVRRFIQYADNGTTKREIELLVSGGVIRKEIRQELTYQNMYDSIENIWSVLLTTGYLTQRGKAQGNFFSLTIPNQEIRNIFETQIMDYFKENVRKNSEALKRFCEALKEGQTSVVEECLGEYLRRTISIRDTFVRKNMKENFYHGMLIGILSVRDGWGVASNRESGDGYSDILVDTNDGETGMIIELKYADDGNMEAACKKALEQIKNSRYEEELLDDGIHRILKYGIAFHKKRCMVRLEK